MRSMIGVSALALVGFAYSSGVEAQPYGYAPPPPALYPYAPQASCGSCGYAAAPVWAPPPPAYPQTGCGSCSYAPPVPVWTPPPPPPPIPGQCFAKVLIPAVTETVPEQVQVTPGRSETIVTPGETRTEEKSVLTREASAEFINVPPTYRTVTETVVIKRASTRIDVIPAIYDTVTEQVKVRDAYEEWRPGSLVAGYTLSSPGAYGSTPRADGGYVEHNPAYGGVPTKQLPTGGVLCLISVPAEYKTVTKQVLRTPSRTVETPVPEQTEQVSRQVVDQPAHVEKKIIPAIYGVVAVTIGGPDKVQSVSTVPTFETYARTRLVTPTRFEWREVSCTAQAGAAAYPEAPPAAYQPPAPQPSYSSY